jgi:abortive infection bacteriophage resistance protein
MFKNILIVENNIKSVMSYIMSKKYGIREKDYLRFTNFSRDSLKTRKVNDVLGKMKRQIKINSKQHSATLHYIMNYGYIPMWILVKVLSFGIVSELYSILRNEDMEEIANYYEISPNELEIFLSVTANYRNLCAHEDILFDHKTQRNIPDTKYHELLNIPKVDGEYVYGKNDFFSVIIIMKHLLTKEEFRLLIYEIGYEIDLLDGKVSSIPLSKILHRVGFVDNWRDILE